MSCRLKHLAVAAAIIGLATQVHAGYFPGSTDFESANANWTIPADGEIVADATVPQTRPATCIPSTFSTDRENVLSVDNDAADPIICTLGDTASSASTIYADVLVKGYPLAYDAPAPDVGQTDKLLVYTRVNAGGTATNLCVLAGSQTNEYVLTKSIGKDEWHRIVIKADNGAYQVFCDELDTPCATTGNVATFYPINTGNAMTSVAFAGSGSVDDVILSTYKPDLSVTTLAWDPATFDSISCTTNGFAVEGLTVANGSYELQVPAGVTVELTGDTGFRTVSVDGTTGAAPLELEVAAAGIAKYFPVSATPDQDGSATNPYEIPNVAALKALAGAANDGLLAGGELHFKQTANIDMSTAGAFEGIGAVGAENATTLTMNAFEGVYDGNNKTISNITFTNRKGSGLFNLVRNATIKDLTVDTVSYEAPFAAAKLGGAMIVGNGVNCTLQHLVTLGSNGLGNPSTYNAAGIANRLEGRGGPVLVIGCTNNAAIYGCYSKIGGICPIVQGDSTTVTFVDCANFGDIVAYGTTEQTTLSGKTPGVDGAAGILAYTQGGNGLLSLTNCVNTGTITGVSGSKIASILGYTTASGITIVGGSAQADVLSVNTGADKVTGAKFATVDNGVATFVADDALAAGKTYKVMSGNATATYEFTAPGSISFNTALATPTYNITASGLAGNVTSATEAPVTTYTVGYFPRTATAGQDGTAEHPFEIADLDDLQALQAAVAADIGRNLCYTQTADIALTAAWEGIGVKGGKDLAAGNATQKAEYEAGAFTGVYDGGNHTISNFLMENGTDYGALFNSISGATIKNLKMSWSTTKLCANSASGGSDTGATFVGVAKESTLFNLTALEGTNKVVYASKDFGGIVGYLMAGSTVDSCTNELNVASLKGGRKCGGIAIITQNGSGTATIRNCKNSGTIAGGAQDGAIVGYIGTTTAIIGCENTANAPLLTSQSGTVTVSGGTKSVANRTPFVMNGGTVNGLNFAIVDDNVATFVEDNALAAGNTYKVMAADATATFAFAEAGTIAFDTSLSFEPTYAITAAEGLTLTDATSGNVKTFTATVHVPTYTVDWTGSQNVDVSVDGDAWDGGTSGSFTNGTEIVFTPDQGMVITNVAGEAVGHLNSFTLTVTQATNIVVIADTVQPIGRIKPAWAEQADTTKFWAWVDDNNVSDYANEDYTTEYLLNVATGEDPAPEIKITSIEVGATATTIEIRGTVGRGVVDFSKLNGVLNIAVGSSVTALTPKAIPAANLDVDPEVPGVATVTIPAGNGSFFRAQVDFVAPSTPLVTAE